MKLSSIQFIASISIYIAFYLLYYLLIAILGLLILRYSISESAAYVLMILIGLASILFTEQIYRAYNSDRLSHKGLMGFILIPLLIIFSSTNWFLGNMSEYAMENTMSYLRFHSWVNLSFGLFTILLLI